MLLANANRSSIDQNFIRLIWYKLVLQIVLNFGTNWQAPALNLSGQAEKQAKVTSSGRTGEERRNQRGREIRLREVPRTAGMRWELRRAVAAAAMLLFFLWLKKEGRPRNHADGWVPIVSCRGPVQTGWGSFLGETLGLRRITVLDAKNVGSCPPFD